MEYRTKVLKTMLWEVLNMSAKEQLLKLLENADDEMLAKLQEAIKNFYELKTAKQSSHPLRPFDQ